MSLISRLTSSIVFNSRPNVKYAGEYPVDSHRDEFIANLTAGSLSIQEVFNRILLNVQFVYQNNRLIFAKMFKTATPVWRILELFTLKTGKVSMASSWARDYSM